MDFNHWEINQVSNRTLRNPATTWFLIVATALFALMNMWIGAFPADGIRALASWSRLLSVGMMILAVIALQTERQKTAKVVMVVGAIIMAALNIKLGYIEPFRLDNSLQALANGNILLCIFIVSGMLGAVGIERGHAKKIADRKAAALAALEDRRRASKNIPRIHVHEPHRLSPDTAVPIYCDTCGTMHKIRARNVHPHGWHCEPCRVLVENHWLD